VPIPERRARRGNQRSFRSRQGHLRSPAIFLGRRNVKCASARGAMQCILHCNMPGSSPDLGRRVWGSSPSSCAHFVRELGAPWPTQGVAFDGVERALRQTGVDREGLEHSPPDWHFFALEQVEQLRRVEEAEQLRIVSPRSEVLGNRVVGTQPAGPQARRRASHDKFPLTCPEASKRLGFDRVKLALGSSLAICAALCSGPAQAEGREGHVSVHWSAPKACPNEADLKQAIEAHLGQPLSFTREQPLAILANVSADGAGYTARLRFQSPSGVEERVLDHPSCGKLLDAAALVIALAIDPAGVSTQQSPVVSASPESLPPAPEPASAPAPTAAVATPPPPSVFPSPPRRATPTPGPTAPGAPLQYPLSVFGLVGARALPSLGPGIGAGIGLSRGHFELGLVGRYWLPRSQPVPGTESSEISVAWLAAELRGCAVPWLGAWRLRLCASAGAGDISGRGVGVDKSRTRHTAVPTFSAGAFLGYGLGRASPFVGVSSDWLLLRPRLGVMQNDDIIEVYKSSALALSGVLGLIYRL
jgi:hypothetical protein